MLYPKWFGRLICGWVISLLVIMAQGSVLADGGGDGTTVTVGGYTVSLVFAEPAKRGENSLHVQILDEQGKPVSGAEVEISAIPVEETEEHQENMQAEEPSMDGMNGSNAAPDEMDPPETEVHDETITAILEPGEESGEYAGKITFSNADHWMLSAHITINGENLEAEFPVDVAGRSLSGGILAGFAGLIIVVIAIAAISRRKPASA